MIPGLLQLSERNLQLLALIAAARWSSTELIASFQAPRVWGQLHGIFLMLGAVAVLGIGIVGYSVGSNALGTAATMPVDVEGLDDMERLVELAQGVTRGDPDAPITIVEFGDFQCPGCGQFALQVKPQIDLTYVQPGQAKFVFYDYPLVEIGHQHAFLAARAARCAGDQDRYWEYHDALFRNQSSWSGQSQVVGSFVSYADQVGLDTDTFEACLRSERHADVVTLLEERDETVSDRAAIHRNFLLRGAALLELLVHLVEH